MQKITDANYDDLVGGSATPVVLDFGATWCGPCKKLEPIIAELSQENDGKVLVGKVDISEAPGVAQKFGIMSVPTVVFLKDGQPVHQFSGLESKAKITELMSQHLGV